ncbi:hypothetical protein QBC37DRAFT_413330 [Rhypophila decipiens]|uniref:Uncharacterized protein n=1 Tax=Rhypophila decipiens TaxID=261697 RepID=A0AAN7BBX5_9PEZI|nr:hypothetical protein QBC37DRAFT_413330 [Rhypophila decipiens]
MPSQPTSDSDEEPNQPNPRQPPPIRPLSLEHHPNPPVISSTTTLIFFLILILAFFPGIFHFLWAFPLHCVNLLFSLGFRGSGSSHLSPTTGSHNPADSYTYSSPNNKNNVNMWYQKQFSLPARSRGSYLITSEVLEALPQIKEYKVGLLNLFVQHTSCALSLNENWDPDVREDMSDTLDRIVPEAGPKNPTLYRHDAEGPDDLPAHVKSALIGASVTIPIKDGKLQTGTWQGIWYLEFRAAKHTRRVVATIQGEKA